MEAERQRGLEANKAREEKNWPQARIAYRNYIDGSGFRRLPEDEQRQALRLGANIGLYHGDKNLGYSYLLRLTAMPQATSSEWIDLITNAHAMKYEGDAARGLVEVAKRWPEKVPELDDDLIDWGIAAIGSQSRDVQLKSLWSLYGAHLRLHWGYEPSWAWRDLALLLLEKGRVADAVEVSRHITHSLILITMRADRRFDALVAANPTHFDIAAAARQELREAQAISDMDPKRLLLKLDMVKVLQRLRDYGAMLAVTDDLKLEIKSTNFPSRLFTDYDEQYPSLLNARSTALERLGRTEEAVQELAAASRLPEMGAKNTSQVINLGALYCRLDRPLDARAVIATVGGVNVDGGIALEAIRLIAAVKLKDERQVAKSLALLGIHRKDRPFTYEVTSMIAGQADAAANSLIARLLDPDSRQVALMSVQDFLPVPGASWDKPNDDGWQSLIARSDVQAAIRKIGRVESYRLELVN